MGFLDGLLGKANSVLTGGNSDKANAAMEKALAAMQAVELPDIEKMQLELEGMVQQGKLSPEEAQLFLQEKSQMNGVSTDPKLMQAQLDALSGLQDISNSNGLTLGDKAKLSDIQSQENAQARGQREAILQSAQARGLGGSGISLMAQLQNQQDSATRASKRGTDVAAAAQDRALQALMQSGNLGGQIQENQFNQKAQVAKANDAINQFNTQNMQQTGNLNTGLRNTAQAANLAEKQRVADSNVGTRNQQQMHNKGLYQQQFNNELAKAGGMAQQYGNMAQNFNQQGAGIQNMIGTGATMAMMMSDEREKEKVEEFNPSEFLDSLTGYKYSYKKPQEHGHGRHAGVMAQDLEKTPEGSAMVEETPDGKKMVDYGKGFGTMLASMAEIHERLKKVEGAR